MSGQLGNGELTLINDASGVIESTSGAALIIDTGGSIVTNLGTIQGDVEVQSAINNYGTLASDGGNLYLEAPVTNYGVIDANGGNLYVEASVDNAGTGQIEVQSGTLTLNDAVTGTGSAIIAGGATLDFAAAASVSQITFNNGSGPTYGEVIFGNESGLNHLDATVYGFAGSNSSNSDVIDLAGTWTQQSETTSGGNTTLVLADSANGGETVTLTFDNFTDSLTVVSDGHGGTEIYDPPGTGSSSASSNGGSVSITGPGNDTFVFHPGMGAETISNFNPQVDNIELDHFANAQNFQQLAADITSNAHGDALIELGHNDSITVAGMTAAQLQAHLQSFVHLH